MKNYWVAIAGGGGVLLPGVVVGLPTRYDGLALPLRILFEEENSLYNSKMRFYLKVLMSDFLKV